VPGGCERKSRTKRVLAKSYQSGSGSSLHVPSLKKSIRHEDAGYNDQTNELAEEEGQESDRRAVGA
jgi:hypothetical protein